jgi:tetratricopeptide (TPR) repeat protein
MEALKRAAERAETGHGQIVAAIADAGVGKSRLFHEFKATIQSGWLVLEALSVSHGKATAYLPLIELLHDYFGIEPEDDSRKRREKVNGKVLTLDRALEDALPHVLGLLGLNEGDDPLAGMDAEVRRRRMVEALKRILLRESLNQPLMVIFEDLHWIDAETQAFLNLLADSIGTAKILLLVNYRPEFSHSWTSKSYYTQVRLDPLGKESACEMLDALLGVNARTIDGQLAALKRLITDKTEGNPLFMEEIVQALTEEGALVRNGAVKLTRPLDALKVPPTVQDIIASRIDRLPPPEKELLQTLAVIGMEFTHALAAEVTKKPDDELNRLLNDLQLAEFVYEQPAAGDMGYIFKHALTHDVADKSLLTERRKLLHERAGQAIETLYHGRLDDHYDDLAHHYRLSDNAAKAVEYLRLAGEQAVDRGAYAQALANVESALTLIERLAKGVDGLRTELGVRLMEGRAVAVAYGATSTERLNTFARVCELSEQLSDDSALLRGLLNIGFGYANRGEVLHGQEVASRCLALAEHKQNREMLLYVRVLIARCAYSSGDLIEASSILSEVREECALAPPGIGAQFIPWNVELFTVGTYAILQLTLGRPDAALKLSEEALRRAHQLKHPYTIAMTLTFAATVRSRRREPEATWELAEALMALSEEQGFREQIAAARSYRAWVMAELGQTQQALTEWEAASVTSNIYQRARLIEAYARVGRADQTLAMIDEALAGFETSGARLSEAELYRLKGEATMMHEPSATAEAEACFRKAIEVAKAQSAKWWELRATTSLARLLAKEGKREEARLMLAEIYNWFTEGFDTADLKDAKALLDKLST